MNRSLAFALPTGVLVGVATYGFVAADWHLAVALAAVYAAVAYFAAAGDRSLADPVDALDGRPDRFAYALGVFGASVGPLAFADYLRPVDGALVSFLALFLGVVAFLTVATAT